MSPLAAIDLGQIEVVVSSQVSVFGSTFSKDAKDLAFLMEVPVDYLIDGAVSYTMPRDDDGAFSILSAINIRPSRYAENIKNTLYSSPSLLLAQGACCDLTVESNYTALFIKRSLQDKRDPAIRHVLVDGNGKAVDLQREIDAYDRIIVKPTFDAFDPQQDGMVPLELTLSSSWTRVISCDYNEEGEQYVVAKSASNYILHPDIGNRSLMVIEGLPNSTWVSFTITQSGIHVLQPSNIGPYVLHSDLLFGARMNELTFPQVPIIIRYNGREYAYRYPAFHPDEHTVATRTCTRRLLRLIASALLNGYPKDEGQDLQLAEIFANMDAFEGDLASLLASSVISAIDHLDWDSFLRSVFMAKGPAQFSFSDIPSIIDVRGVHMAFNMEVSFRIYGRRTPYVIKDIAMVFLLT